MAGIYLKCDTCGKTFHGEAVDPVSGNFHAQGYHWSQTQGLQNEARAAGWTGDLTRDSKNDKCPECSKEESSKFTDG